MAADNLPARSKHISMHIRHTVDGPATSDWARHVGFQLRLGHVHPVTHARHILAIPHGAQLPARTDPVSPLRPLRSPSALFHGHEDHDGDPIRVRPGYVAAAFCGSSPEVTFLSARSASHSPSSCTPSARPVPSAPLALVVLPLLRRPSSLDLSSLHRARSAKRERSTATNGLIFRASGCLTTATATSGGGPNWSTSLRFAATPLPACNGYAGLIRVLLATPHPRLIAFLSIYRLTLNLKGFRRRRTMQHGERVWRQSVDDVFGVLSYHTTSGPHTAPRRKRRAPPHIRAVVASPTPAPFSGISRNAVPVPYDDTPATTRAPLLDSGIRLRLQDGAQSLSPPPAACTSTPAHLSYQHARRVRASSSATQQAPRVAFPLPATVHSHRAHGLTPQYATRRGPPSPAACTPTPSCPLHDPSPRRFAVPRWRAPRPSPATPPTSHDVPRYAVTVPAALRHPLPHPTPFSPHACGV
ncbi:hypothetical protein DFH08DRAFT_1046243 [Mycena albidolilacea]|uniref:Uncharacterized protein n=1 Tax=Mycena albidolilacea TaxID=1033008 RepID=A0AAD7EBX1_9AGAR|nr:hypothetical protein DFH08DRAFT_1046243 [Mycena albidolilacea]